MEFLSFPHFKQCRPVEHDSFLHKSERLGRKIALEHLCCLDVYRTDVISVYSVDVRRIVLALLKIHLDDNTIESCNNRHQQHLPLLHSNRGS